MHRILGGAFMLFAAMIVIDLLHWSKTLEDSLKVVAGALIFVGFLPRGWNCASPAGTHRRRRRRG